jgi:hypothetical protein
MRDVGVPHVIVEAKDLDERWWRYGVCSDWDQLAVGGERRDVIPSRVNVEMRASCHAIPPSGTSTAAAGMARWGVTTVE